jgi:hypothetical protein
MVSWSQTPIVTGILTPNPQTNTQTVTDTLSYDRANLLIDWLGKNIVLSENQKKMIAVKGKKIKGDFINKGPRTETIMKQLQTVYKAAIDSILTTEQKDKLAPQFNASEAK